MKIERLDLIAFGPFADTQLDFSRGGFCLVEGPNEAGKSTTLRAIQGFLFGIPSATQDAHLHAMPDLRVGACLSTAAGQRFDWIRRKGNKNTLLNRDESPVDEAILARCLGGANGELFETTFGLNHVTLAEGAEKLLAGKGALGQVLFDVGSAGPSVRELLDRLRKEAEDIYKPRGSRKLNQEIDGYKKALSQTKESQILPDEWARKEEEIATLTRELSRLEEERATVLQELHRLRRIQKTRRHVARRRELHQGLADLGAPPGGQRTLPELPRDARERRERVELALRESRREMARCEQEMAEINGKLASLKAPGELAELGEERLKSLRNRLGSHLKASDDLPRVRGECAGLEAEAQARLRRAGKEPKLEGVERWLPNLAALQRVERLTLERAALLEKLDGTRVALTEVRHQQHEAHQAQIAAPPELDLGPLAFALEQSRAEGGLERRLREAEGEVRSHHSDAERLCATLSGAAGVALKELVRLALPSPETAGKFATRLSELQDHLRQKESRRDDLEREREDAEAALLRLEAEGEVPSEAQLEGARVRRSEGWALVRRAWRDREEVSAELRGFAGDLPLDQAYERSVEAADNLADRLRREASRVAKRGELKFALERSERRLGELREGLKELAQKIQAVELEWRAAWRDTAILPLSPKEMLPWLQRHREVTTLYERWGVAERRRESLASQRERLRTGLTLALSQLGVVPAAGSDLESLTAQAAELHKRLTQEARQRELLRGKLAETEKLLVRRAAELRDSEQAIEQWKSRWNEAMLAVGLTADTDPEEARVVLEQLRELQKTLEHVEERRRRIAGMERDAASFRESIEALLAKHAPELQSLRLEDAADRFLHLADEARREKLTRTEQLRALDQRKERHHRAQHQEAEAAAELGDLLRAAAVGSPEELPHVEAKVELARELGRELAQREEALREESYSSSIEELVTEVDSIEPESALARLEELEERSRGVEAEIQSLRDRRSRQQGEIERLGETPAAESLEQAQFHLTRMRSQVERWLRLKLAANVLEREVERYREQNQGPILSQANLHFPRLTLGAFRGMRVEFGKSDQPVLRCEREDGSRVDIEHLSDGTRDQLFLALRLATIERWVGSSEPLPVVLDDVLVHFDDDRARAALEVLGEVAQKTQILFFTHHRRLRELAEEAVPRSILTVHELQRRAPGATERDKPPSTPGGPKPPSRS